MILCFDLDGTLCEVDESIPHPERYYKATVKPVMRQVVHSFYNKGHTVIIDTARGSSARGLTKYYTRWKLKQLTKSQLKQWDIPYHTLRVGVKFPAELYIDDRGIPPSMFERTPDKQ